MFGQSFLGMGVIIQLEINISINHGKFVYSCKCIQRKEGTNMKVVVDNNIMKAFELEVSADGIIPEVAVVSNVRISNVIGAEGKRTDKVEAVRYDCVNPDNFSTFTLKVEATRPVVTKEILEATEEPVYISIPVDAVAIRPYAIEYGQAKVSIIAPYVKLAEN